MFFHSPFEWRKISPETPGYEYLFGYYDRCPWNVSGDKHLALKIPELPNRIPRRGETAEVGYLDGQGQFFPLATTRAWCYQQGSMELFLKHKPDCFLYNDYDEASGRIVARICQLDGRGIGQYSRSIYAISPNGRYGVSLDFCRIPRRGYSYADAPLSPDRFPRDLDADGLWLVDLENGAERLLVSYRAMLREHPAPYTLEGQYLWLNHAIFNCDSTRVLWLLRSIPDEIGLSKPWRTYLYTADLQGNHVKCSLPDVYWSGMISHQIWGATPSEIMVDANWDGTGHHVVVYDDNEPSLHARKIAESHGMMSHLVYSPDGSMILADSYPDAQGMQTLLLIQAKNGKSVLLGKFRHNAPPGTIVDKRCDLHPRWNPAGDACTVDSNDSGKRAVYLLELGEAIRQCREG